ncbi:hypothetical protein PSI9734_01784 [Pseudidiomarina piscicola]|uniref:Solute-binding protein family 3/N-terminal domain-containing protein n=1 Tax=Pseudidiomarina piscicola TaxID=2614830 RepID=A0A6S6WQ49_9GAMM|nr:hypothetical protein [Pseudidiomarina piscicola]CAB0151396.1 hypothetical protein PSI9734_01784 [Pseudidiomarina piscicola]VZT40876.1 hypothetical protein PSI9734_01784 [Pseudomonas aeruginosa]
MLLCCTSALAQTPAPDEGQNAPERPKELVFRKPVSSPIADFVVQLFREAYAQLGIQLRFEEMPRNRSLTEANNGRIAGELGRIPRLHDEYTNLVRVNFRLYESEVVMIADRRECGLCGFSTIDSFAYIGGTQSVEAVLNERAIDLPNIQVVDLAQLKLLFNNQRVDAILVNDFEAEQLNLDSDYTISVPYKRNSGYHFLHKKYAFLVPQIEAILGEMLTSGRVLEIIQENQAQIRTTPGFEQAPQFGHVRLTAGLWPEYTNPDGTGSYWDVVEKIFAPVSSQLSLQTNTFHRAYRGIDGNRFDAFVGALGQQIPTDTILSRNHIDFDSPLFLFAASDQALEQVLKGTMRQPICHVAGYDYQDLLPAQLNYYSASSQLDCFAMLDMNRMGAVISYPENAPDWTNSPYSMVKLRDAVPIYVVFQKTPRGYHLRDWFDTKFREMVRTGAIKDLYSEQMLQRAYLNLSLPDARQTPVKAPTR